MWWDRKDICCWPICVTNACIAGGEGSCEAHLNASMPKKMEALSDTCLQIPCSFDSVPSNRFDESKPMTGVWTTPEKFKRVVFHSNQTNNIYPISIIGNMSEYNCTTVFTRMNSSYAGVYYFRVENINHIATDTCNPLTITVNGMRTLLVWDSIFWLLSL